jgi:hypothetical protein
MKFKNLLQLLIIISGFSIMLSACKTKSETSENYLITIDSIRVPDVITSKVQFEVRLFGTVGPNGCYSFESFYNYPYSDEVIMIEAWGRFYYDGSPCTGQVVFLDEVMDLTISTPGVYLLRTLKPDGRYLEKEITVN